MDRERDHVVQVTNGTVDSASRKTSGRNNIRWVITETPDGDEDLVMTMAAPTGGELVCSSISRTIAGP